MDAWDQRESETDKAFAAFRAYLELGPSRSISRVAAGEPKGTANRTRRPATLKTWSSEHSWVERAEAFDREAARQADAAFFAENAASVRRSAKRAEDFQDALTRPVRELVRRLEADPKALEKVATPELLSVVATSSRAFAQVLKAERLARGLSTEAPSSPVAELDLDARTEEELEKMLAEEAAKRADGAA